MACWRHDSSAAERPSVPETSFRPRGNCRAAIVTAATKSAAPASFTFGEVKCSTHTVLQFLDEIRGLLADRRLQPRTLLCVNAHIYNLASRDPALARRLRKARVVTADGMAIVWTAPLFDTRIPERCNMTEAFRAFLGSSNMPASEAVLVGCSEAEAAAAAREISRVSRHCRAAHAYSGYLTNEEYGEIFRRHEGADFILLGMGSPRTEEVAGIAAAYAPQAIVWGIGGGTIRIFAGTMREAPPVWRRLGLQWLYRLLSDPRELWRRYLLGNPLFLWRLLCARFRAHAGSAE